MPPRSGTECGGGDTVEVRLAGPRLREVSKRYRGKNLVLDQVTVDIHDGEVVAVRGDNGSGKSTLLKIIVGISTPTAGEVTSRPRRVGYVPERFPSRQRMPARSYLVHMGRIRGLRTRQARTRAVELLHRLKLVGGVDTPLRHLSKGNAQKVAIAQALMVPSDLLVLDEPWSGLDESAHATLREMIGELAAGGTAVVFTDHREAVSKATASTVYRLTQGRLTEALPDYADPVVDMATVVLVRPEGPWPAGEPDWARDPGVLRVARAGSHTASVTVVGEHCDALLSAALGAGWSVERVERTSAPRGGRRWEH
jgi:ABC-type Mn2+/Zn2+ transport system ATPase subunit